MMSMNGVEGISLSPKPNQGAPHLAVVADVKNDADMSVLNQGAVQKRCSPLTRINPLQSDNDGFGILTNDIALFAVSSCGGGR